MNQSSIQRFAFLILLASGALQFGAFARWPGSPEVDVVHSIFAAYNFVTGGHLQSINAFPQNTDDLARHAQLYWMTHWPPAHSWLYALMMWLGLSAGAATKLLGFLCIIGGGIGWIRLATVLGASRICVAVVAASYPWIWIMGRIYIDYKNDHLAIALVPWVYLGIVQVDLDKAQWLRLIATALLAGSTILVKYSLAPVLAATGLYFLWLEGRALTFTVEKMLRIAVFSTGLVLPGALLWLANRAWGIGSYPSREGVGVSPPLLNHIISNTFGAPTGWSALLTQLNIALESYSRLSLFRGAIFAISLMLMMIWAPAFLRTKWTVRQLHFLQYMCLLTTLLWALLYMVGLTSEGRLYIPIGFGWIVLGAVVLDKMPWNLLIRSLRFYSIGVPVLFSFFFYAATGLFGDRYATMPNSKLRWWDYDQDHAAFPSRLMKERGRGPDLIVTPQYNVMVELRAPIYWRYQSQRGRTFYSSKNLEVWAMIDQNYEKIFLSEFRKASAIESVAVPSGFPFKFYILTFDAKNE
jgi:hypothetical protein